MCSPNGTSTQSSFRKPLNQTSDFPETDVSGKPSIENNSQDYALNAPTNFRDLNSSTRFLADDSLKNGQIVGQTRTFNDPLGNFFDSLQNEAEKSQGPALENGARTPFGPIISGILSTDSNEQLTAATALGIGGYIGGSSIAGLITKNPATAHRVGQFGSAVGSTVGSKLASKK
jgi:hypothetical protein